VATTNPYRTAHTAGANGKNLPAGLASRATSDPLIDQAHDAGRNGVDFDSWHAENAGQPEGEQEGTGDEEEATELEGTSGSSGGRRLSVPKLSGGSHSAAGVALGMVAYALVLSVVDYGTKGPWYWFSAKFLNRAVAAKGKTKATTSATATAVLL
jgi:hypothetical protein